MFWYVSLPENYANLIGNLIINLLILQMSYPLVIDCAAVATYDKTEKAWLPRAFVMLTSDCSVDIEIVKQEILSIIKRDLPDHKQLRGGLYIIKDLPRNSTGKVNRRELANYNLVACL